MKTKYYADDLTAFVKDERWVSNLFSLLNDFGTCSGLKINLLKTEGMWLGSLKHHLGNCAQLNIAWPEKYVFALGVAYDSTTSYKINFKAKLVTLKNILHQWTTRNLNVIGRICIIKTLAISMVVVYNTSLLKVPPNLPEKVHDIFFKFIWNLWPDRVTCQIIVLSVGKGGLNMVDFTTLDKSLKAAWIKR